MLLGRQITGSEQRGHFAALGLADKHLPIGLVLGPDGKKVKSSGGDPLLAAEAFDLVAEQLDPTPSPKQLTRRCRVPGMHSW